MTTMKFLALSLLLLVTTRSYAHTPSCRALVRDTSISNLYLYTDVYPTFPGGNKKLKEFIEENLKWPLGEIDFAGTVLTSFTVEKDGRLTNVKIERSGCQLCNVESLRLIDSMPNWKPGRIAGKSVRTLLYLPIRFEIKE
ncbi:TonB protein C-terminal [Chitinophaga sp. CF118]|uniref:energy transducer TonB n=1 Tax=Chitinophaga sp. CF118 TaxID=1884367 RepID=UPI0008ECE5EF|nr:energy transducer TonB [Chitinophaga sp. CF118]SFE45629.1 TonB protein C-terminal [Chitinophaga sp. CF118]